MQTRKKTVLKKAMAFLMALTMVFSLMAPFNVLASFDPSMPSAIVVWAGEQTFETPEEEAAFIEWVNDSDNWSFLVLYVSDDEFRVFWHWYHWYNDPANQEFIEWLGTLNCVEREYYGFPIPYCHTPGCPICDDDGNLTLVTAAVLAIEEAFIDGLNASVKDVDNAINAENYVDDLLTAMNLNGVTFVINTVSFEAAVPGDDDVPEGEEGYFTFTVTVTANPSGTTDELTLVLPASEWAAPLCNCVVEEVGVMHICDALQPRIAFTPLREEDGDWLTREWIEANFADHANILTSLHESIGANTGRDVLIVNFTEEMNPAASFQGTVSLGTGMTVTERRWSLDRRSMILEISWIYNPLSEFHQLRNEAVLPDAQIHTTFTIRGFYALNYNGELYMRTPVDEIEENDFFGFNAVTIARPLVFGGPPEPPGLYVVWVSAATLAGSSDTRMEVVDGGITRATCDENLFLRSTDARLGPLDPAPWTRDSDYQYIAVHFSMPVSPDRGLGTIGVSEIESNEDYQTALPRGELSTSAVVPYHVVLDATNGSWVRGVVIPNTNANVWDGFQNRTVRGIVFPDEPISSSNPAHVALMQQLATVLGCRCFGARYNPQHHLFAPVTSQNVPASNNYVCTVRVSIIDTRVPNASQLRSYTRYRVNVDGFHTQDRSACGALGGSAANPNEEFETKYLYDLHAFFQHTFWVGEGETEGLVVAQIWISTTEDPFADFYEGLSVLIYSDQYREINPVFGTTDPNHWAYNRVIHSAVNPQGVLELLNRNGGIDLPIAANYLTIIYNRPVLADINSIDISGGPLAVLEGVGGIWLAMAHEDIPAYLYGDVTTIGANGSNDIGLVTGQRGEDTWGGDLPCEVAAWQALQGFLDMSIEGRYADTVDAYDSTGRIAPLPAGYSVRTNIGAPFARRLMGSDIIEVDEDDMWAGSSEYEVHYAAFNANQWNLSLFSADNRVVHDTVFDILNLGDNDSDHTDTHRPYGETFSLTVEGWICAFYWRENFENYRIGAIQTNGTNYNWDGVYRFGDNRINLEVHEFTVEDDPVPFVIAWSIVGGSVTDVTNALRAELTGSASAYDGNYDFRRALTMSTNAGLINPLLYHNNVVDGVAGRRWTAGSYRHTHVPLIELGLTGLGGNRGTVVLVFSERVQNAVSGFGTIQISGGGNINIVNGQWIHDWQLHNGDTVNASDESRYTVSVFIFEALALFPTGQQNSITVIGYPELVWFDAPWRINDIPNTAANIAGTPYQDRVVGHLTAERLYFIIQDN